MRHLGIVLLIYSAFVLDLRAAWWSAGGLRPSVLDLALLAVCAAERTSSAVLYGAAIGCLSALVMGTQPGLGMIAGSTAAFPFTGIRANSSPPRGWSPLRAALALAVFTGERAVELSWGATERTAVEPALWRLAGNTALTLLTFLVMAGLVGLLRRPALVSNN